MFGGALFGQSLFGDTDSGLSISADPLVDRRKLKNIITIGGGNGIRLSLIPTITGDAGDDLEDVYGTSPAAVVDSVYKPARPWRIGALRVGARAGAELVAIRTTDPPPVFDVDPGERLPRSGYRLSEI
jgi:hypothetical protein